MKLKPLAAALLGVGIIAANTSSAVNWNPSEWFAHKQPAAATAASPAPNDGPAAAPAAPAASVPTTGAPNYRAIVERFGPAVVGVTTEGMVDASSHGQSNDLENDPFFRFFRGIPGFQGRVPNPDTPVRGLGSGFIVGSDGVILTNAHVVRDASTVTVKLNDRREFKAKVLGSDQATDVAVLKIDAHNLPVVNIGNPDRLGVGDYVLAIGAPFGFEQSATSGIVSAKGRSLPGDSYVPFIQTDVAVNPGNSGGPLFDANGNVIGINSQIYSRTGGYQGVSFAIPIDVALNVKNQVLTTGKVSHARLGVSVQEVNQALAESFKLDRPEGALVSSVVPGSAAQKAGLQPGDIILKFNGKPIVSSGDLSAMVGSAKPGDKANFEVWRNGQRQERSATLTAATDAAAADASPAQGQHGKLGVAVRPLTPEEKQEAKVASGVVVEDSAGAAARAGVQAGDIIVSVNGNAVKSVEDLQKAMASNHKTMALLIQRGDEKIFIPVAMG